MSTIHILNLGAGVQSSTMALMAAAGEITPMPLAAIFADTKSEPASVYRWLDWLEMQLPFPVIRVCNKDGLESEVLRIHERRDGKGKWIHSGIPHYSTNSDGTTGHGQRQCTHDFKITPIMRQVRALLKQHGAKRAIQWIGISTNEAHRMKPVRVKYAEHRWPLIELRMDRNDCLRWMEARKFPKPPRSACVFCPYHSDNEWRRLKNEEPEEFERACRFDEEYRRLKVLTVSKAGFVPYLHASRVPLREVDLRTPAEKGQPDLALEFGRDGFGNECEGMCGV